MAQCWRMNNAYVYACDGDDCSLLICMGHLAAAATKHGQTHTQVKKHADELGIEHKRKRTPKEDKE